MIVNPTQSLGYKTKSEIVLHPLVSSNLVTSGWQFKQMAHLGLTADLQPSCGHLDGVKAPTARGGDSVATGSLQVKLPPGLGTEYFAQIK